MKPITHILVAAAALSPVIAFADGPGAGLTAQYETAFMKMAIDHHFAALRMTELAAGTGLPRGEHSGGN
jgi:hypothetical protein